MIVSYLENRTYVADRSGTLQQRLERARAKALSILPVKGSMLESWIQKYRQLANSPKTDATLLRRAEQEIRALDAELFLCGKLPELVNGAVYYYYRLGWPSPCVGETLGIAAPHCRQILYRLGKTAKRLGLA